MDDTFYEELPDTGLLVPRDRGLISPKATSNDGLTVDLKGGKACYKDGKVMYGDCACKDPPVNKCCEVTYSVNMSHTGKTKNGNFNYSNELVIAYCKRNCGHTGDEIMHLNGWPNPCPGESEAGCSHHSACGKTTVKRGCRPRNANCRNEWGSGIICTWGYTLISGTIRFPCEIYFEYKRTGDASDGSNWSETLTAGVNVPAGWQYYVALDAGGGGSWASWRSVAKDSNVSYTGGWKAVSYGFGKSDRWHRAIILIC